MIPPVFLDMDSPLLVFGFLSATGPFVYHGILREHDCLTLTVDGFLPFVVIRSASMVLLDSFDLLFPHVLIVFVWCAMSY